MSINSTDRFETVEEFWQTLNAFASPKRDRVQIPRVMIEDVKLPFAMSDTERMLIQSPQEQFSPFLARRLAIALLASLELLVLIALVVYFLLHG